MERIILKSSEMYPDAQKFISNNHAETVKEVIDAISKNKIVIVGMSQNPVVKKARKILEEKQMEYKYLAYGSYVSKWQERLAIKLWSGWPTFPQVFIDGKLVGGAADLERLLANK